jgi:hypothetical protein
VLENRMLRRIFGPKRNKVAGDWSKVNNRDLHKVYFSPDIIRVIKQWRMILTGLLERN